MNLARWNIIVCPVCPLCCSNQPTTNHILTGCSTALNQGRYRGRYTWHHDSVLQVFSHDLQKNLPPCYKLYANLPGHLASTSPPTTVPQSFSSSSSRLDIVLISDDGIILLELSVVTNTEQHFAAASSRKVARYGPLLADLERTGLFVELVTIEVGCLGHFLPSTISNLCRVCHLQKCSVRAIFEEAAQVAISCSYKIFNAYSSELWDISELLTVFLANVVIVYCILQFCLDRDPATCVSGSCVPLSLGPPYLVYSCSCMLSLS